jgi:hypothetical protein
MEPTTCCELVPLIIELDPSIAILMLTAVYEKQCNSLHDLGSISRTSSGSCAVTMKPFRSRGRTNAGSGRTVIDPAVHQALEAVVAGRHALVCLHDTRV